MLCLELQGAKTCSTDRPHFKYAGNGDLRDLRINPILQGM